MPTFETDRNASSAGGFSATHWSLVLKAKDPTSPQAQQALAALCEIYWYPLYVYVRRQGYPADEAQDLTLDFIAHILEKPGALLKDADPAKGQFRSLLRVACNHFLADERDRSRAKKRGGGLTLVSIDSRAAEGRYGREPSHDLTPERLFDRQWALTILERALSRLDQEYRAGEKGELYARLKSDLAGEPSRASYAQIAAALGMTEAAVKQAAYRLRQRCGSLLREEIARTVDGPGQVEAEIRELFSILGS